MWPPHADPPVCGILQSHAVFVVHFNHYYWSLFDWFDDHPQQRVPGIEVTPPEGERAQVGAVGNGRSGAERECQPPFRLKIEAV